LYYRLRLIIPHLTHTLARAKHHRSAASACRCHDHRPSSAAITVPSFHPSLCSTACTDTFTSSSSTTGAPRLSQSPLEQPGHRRHCRRRRLLWWPRHHGLPQAKLLDWRIHWPKRKPPRLSPPLQCRRSTVTASMAATEPPDRVARRPWSTSSHDSTSHECGWARRSSRHSSPLKGPCLVLVIE
jgi:hypothetical protein